MARAAAAAGPAAGRVVAGAFAAAPSVRDPFGVRQLVPQTALQAAAEARQLGGVQAELLLLRHLDRHGFERREERRAAERTAARPVAADHLRLVADADLPHLDTHAELAGQFAHQLAEIHATLGCEVEDHPRTVELHLDAGELHAEPSLANFQRRDAEGLLLPVLLLEARDDVFSGRDADDPRGRLTGRKPPLDELRNRSHDSAHRGPVLILHDHPIAGVRLSIARSVRRHHGVVCGAWAPLARESKW